MGGGGGARVSEIFLPQIQIFLVGGGGGAGGRKEGFRAGYSLVNFFSQRIQIVKKKKKFFIWGGGGGGR